MRDLLKPIKIKFINLNDRRTTNKFIAHKYEYIRKDNEAMKDEILAHIDNIELAVRTYNHNMVDYMINYVDDNTLYLEREIKFRNYILKNKDYIPSLFNFEAVDVNILENIKQVVIKKHITLSAYLSTIVWFRIKSYVISYVSKKSNPINNYNLFLYNTIQKEVLYLDRLTINHLIKLHDS